MTPFQPCSISRRRNSPLQVSVVHLTSSLTSLFLSSSDCLGVPAALEATSEALPSCESAVAPLWPTKGSGLCTMQHPEGLNQPTRRGISSTIHLDASYWGWSLPMCMVSYTVRRNIPSKSEASHERLLMCRRTQFYGLLTINSFQQLPDTRCSAYCEACVNRSDTERRLEVLLQVASLVPQHRLHLCLGSLCK